MIRSAHYTRNAETVQERKARLARALEQPTPTYHGRALSETSQLRGIPAVKATEVRVSPRWQPSKRARSYARSTGKARQAARAAAAPKRDDRLLMAHMASIHVD